MAAPVDNIVVLGGAGYAGRYLVQHCRKIYPDSEIVVISRNKSKAMFFLGMDRVAVHDRMSDLNLRTCAVINLAYELGLSYKETRYLNETMIRNLFASLSADFSGIIIHISSIAVYCAFALDPDYVPGPLTRNNKSDLYTYAKCYAENLLCDLCAKSGLKLLVIRSGNIIGPGSDWIIKIIRRLIQHERLIGLDRSHPSNSTFIGNLIYAIGDYIDKGHAFSKNINFVNHAEFGAVPWNFWIDTISDFLKIKPVTWQSDDIADFLPNLRREIRSLVDASMKNAVRALYRGSSSRPLVDRLLNFVDARALRTRVEGFMGRTSSKRVALDFSEYKAAQIYLCNDTIGLEGNNADVTACLPYDLVSAKRSIINWMQFSGFNEF